MGGREVQADGRTGGQADRRTGGRTVCDRTSHCEAPRRRSNPAGIATLRCSWQTLSALRRSCNRNHWQTVHFGYGASAVRRACPERSEGTAPDQEPGP
jgi:hypothetical protein